MYQYPVSIENQVVSPSLNGTQIALPAPQHIQPLLKGKIEIEASCGNGQATMMIRINHCLLGSEHGRLELPNTWPYIIRLLL